jgi:hypothetical protein
MHVAMARVLQGKTGAQRLVLANGLRNFYSRLPGLLTGILVFAAFSKPCDAAELPLEKRIVFGPESAPQWSAPESAVETAAEPSRTGSPVLHWQITVDHFAGEPNYPIGWPRANCALRDAIARDWSDWDYFEFWVFADITRAALPRDPVGLALHTPDKREAYTRLLSELKKGEWVQVRIPLSQVPRRDDVRLMQVHISEANYRHQDRLDFYFDQIALLRYAQPTLLDLAAESEVMFTDARQLAVKFQLAGVKAEDRVEVVCEFRRNGDVVARMAAAYGRGPQRMTMDLSRIQLAPGDYDVVARAPGGAEAAARVRLVASPWK